MDFQLRSIANRLNALSDNLQHLSSGVNTRVGPNKSAQTIPFIAGLTSALSPIIGGLNSVLAKCDTIAKSRSINIAKQIRQSSASKPIHPHLQYFACSEGSISVDDFAKLMPRKQAWDENNNDNHPNLLFACINGLMDYTKTNINRTSALPHCTANQLEKMNLLVSRGWRLDARESGMVAWSQCLWNMNLDQFYVRMICFIHDHMNGAINFVDQDGRSLLHFAAAIYPVTEAIKLTREMQQTGYDIHLRDCFGVTPNHILRINLAETRMKLLMKRSRKVKTETAEAFMWVSQALCFQHLTTMAADKEIPMSIQELITRFVPHGQMIRTRKWEIWNTRARVAKLVFAVVDELHWRCMLDKQQKRLERKKKSNANKKEKRVKSAACANKKDEKADIHAISAEEKRNMWKKRKKKQKLNKRRKKQKKLKQMQQEKQPVSLRVIASYKINVMRSLVPSKNKWRQKREEPNGCSEVLSRGKRVIFSRALRIGRYHRDPTQPQLSDIVKTETPPPPPPRLASIQPPPAPLLAPTQPLIQPLTNHRMGAPVPVPRQMRSIPTIYANYHEMNEYIQQCIEMRTNWNEEDDTTPDDNDNDDGGNDDEKKETEDDHDSDDDVINEMETPF